MELRSECPARGLEGTLRVLHLEDDRADQDLIERLLKKAGIKCAITNVVSKADFVTYLENQTWDLILSDYSLPSFDGFSALTIAKEKCPDTPFIFVTGTLGEVIAVETIK
jgi:CheY-like chemotaxis protein